MKATHHHQLTLQARHIFIDGVDRGDILNAKFENGWVVLDGYATNADRIADRILALWCRAVKA